MNTREVMLREIGITPLWVRRDTIAAQPAASVETTRNSAEAPATAAPPESADARAARIATLDAAELHAEITHCRACELCHARGKALVGAGQLNAPANATHPRWMVIADAPTDAEDQTGNAHIGSTGTLLDAMLHAVGQSRKRGAWLTHLVKCQPPGKRPPNAEEIAACAPLLSRQIALHQPALSLALGETAARSLLGAPQPLADLRKTHGRFEGAVVAATHAPQALLKDPQLKAEAWADLLKASEAACQTERS
jgi:uracil-DNA glycosylase